MTSQHCLASFWRQTHIKISRDLANLLQTNIKILPDLATRLQTNIKISTDLATLLQTNIDVSPDSGVLFLRTHGKQDFLEVPDEHRIHNYCLRVLLQLTSPSTASPHIRIVRSSGNFKNISSARTNINKEACCCVCSSGIWVITCCKIKQQTKEKLAVVLGAPPLCAMLVHVLVEESLFLEINFWQSPAQMPFELSNEVFDNYFEFKELTHKILLW